MDPIFGIRSVEVEKIELLNEKPIFRQRTIKEIIPTPRVLSWVKPVIKAEEAESQIASVAPIDGEEIVKWMHEAAAANAVLQMSAQSYAGAGGRIEARSGDGYIPGVSLRDVHFESVRSSYVYSRGYVVVYTPYGNFRAPNFAATTVAVRDLLLWVIVRAWSRAIQWIGVLKRWLETATTPLKSSILCEGIYGFTSPQFILVIPPLGIRHVDYITFSSDKPQKIVLQFRNPADYSKVLAKVELNIPAGQSTVRLRVFGVGNYLAHIQPEHPCTIDKYVSRRI